MSALQVDEEMAARRLLSQMKINDSHICLIALWQVNAIKEEADGGARTTIR
jgi:hypothetical protein